jgi:ACT domain-containing protein
MAKQPSEICIITVTGVDKVGIIAELACAMARENINIIDVNQRIMESFFVMTMAADFSKATKSLETMKKRLDTLAKKMRLNITLQNEQIFEAIHRI